MTSATSTRIPPLRALSPFVTLFQCADLLSCDCYYISPSLCGFTVPAEYWTSFLKAEKERLRAFFIYLFIYMKYLHDFHGAN